MTQHDTKSSNAPIDYEIFFRGSFDLCCVIEGDKFITISPSWMEVFGYIEEDIMSRGWVGLVHPDDEERTRQAFACGLKKKPLTNRFQTREGRNVWLEWYVPEQPEGPLYLVARDVTQRKMVESQIGQYVIQLRQKAEELERSNEDLEQFAYVASHDLQTPLRKVKNFTMLLQQEYGHLLNDEMSKKYMEMIVAGAERSQELIEGLLSFSRTGRSLKTEKLPLDRPLQDALGILNEYIEERDVHLEVSSLPDVYGDRILLARVFQNLIGNAIKFRDPKKEETYVRVWAEDRGDRWEVSVQDNGLGIGERHLKRIFIIFQRMSSRKNGSGLGLALCKKIVERHGGTIRVESTPGEGSRFIFTLPKRT